MRPPIIAVVLALVLLPLAGTVASAHTELAGSAPAADAIVADPPTEVVLTFSAALLPDSEPQVRVIDPVGDDLVAGTPSLDGAVVTVPLNLAVAPGVHRVDWAITAADEDEQVGSFSFTFAPPDEIATPPSAQPAPGATTTAAPTAAPVPTPAEVATPTDPSPSASAPAVPSSTPTATASAETDDGGGSPAGGLVAGLAILTAAGAAVVLARRGRVDLGDR